MMTGHRIVVATLAIALAGVFAQSASAVSRSPIEQLDASPCPPAAQIAAIRSQFTFTFDSDPTARQGLVCTAAAGSADLTRLQQQAYQTLRIAKALSFSQPLPWTSLSLYDWLASTIHGITFDPSYQDDYCCVSPGVIGLVGKGEAWNGTAKFDDPRGGGGLEQLLGIIVHEARHAEGYAHDCALPNSPGVEAWDRNYQEMGAFGAQTALFLWLGLFTGSSLNAGSDAPSPGYNRDSALYSAQLGLAPQGELFCSNPSADLAVTASAPRSVRAGGRLSYRVTVSNSGPDSSPATYLSENPKGGLKFLSASASQGSCFGPASGESGSTVCSLGPLPSGTHATATLVYRVSARPGSTIGSHCSDLSSFACAGTPRIIGTAGDPKFNNNEAVVTTAVTRGRVSHR